MSALDVAEKQEGIGPDSRGFLTLAQGIVLGM